MPIKLPQRKETNRLAIKNIKRPQQKLMLDSVECSLVPIDQYSHMPSEEKKFGRYAQSTYSLSNFGKSCYVVIAYLNVDFEKYRSHGMSNDEIVNSCVEFLNTPEEKKKGQRKDPKKPYGNLKLFGYNIINKFGKEIAAIELVTDQRTNENFWGTGNR